MSFVAGAATFSRKACSAAAPTALSCSPLPPLTPTAPTTWPSCTMGKPLTKTANLPGCMWLMPKASLPGALGPAADVDPATLAAVGQMGAIWAGGGVLIAWSSLIAVAGFARVSVLDLARKAFLPVMLGLLASTLVAVLIF